jgi:hypothetical protein
MLAPTKVIKRTAIVISQAIDKMVSDLPEMAAPLDGARGTCQRVGHSATLAVAFYDGGRRR